MSKLRVLDLFSGIGGFSLGLERTGGFETVAFCEIEPFPRKVLAKHWPEVPIYDDVRTLTAERLTADGIAVDVITGGFPCQDISSQGKRAGIKEGTRSGLWSECYRLVGELRPKFALFENVSDLLRGPGKQRGGWFSQILSDMARCGYNVEWQNIPAGAVGALHLRERVWLVAYPSEINECSANSKRSIFNYARTETKGPTVGGSSFRKHERISTVEIGGQPCLCELDERLSYTLVQRQLAAFGNTVFPAIPELIGNAILASMKGAA